MTHCKEGPVYYIYNDLRATQNQNPDGHTVQEFSLLDEAIQEFRRLPSEWTTALGIQISERSALDLAQRRETEPVLVADYLRIPEYYGNPEIQELVRQLQKALKIEWMSDFRVLGPYPILYPVPPDLDFVRDPYINGKVLLPDDPKHLITSVSEMYVQGEGWLPTEDVWKIAEKSGYSNPHTQKVSLMHVRYADTNGSVRTGDMHPYQYLLLQERTKLMEHDHSAAKALAEAIEIYLYRNNPSEYDKLFGNRDHLSTTDPSNPKRMKDRAIKQIIESIEHRETSSLLNAVLSGMGNGLTTSAEQAESRELLARILNVPEHSDRKLPLDLRLQANDVLRGLYHVETEVGHHARKAEAVLPERGS